MFSRTHVLISEKFNGGIKPGGSTPLIQPPNWVDWASMYEELTWTLSIEGVTGSPTSWSLGARFQYRQSHSGAAYRFQVPRWYDLADEQIGTHVVEGVGWYGPGQADPVGGAAGVIATQASSLTTPIVITRTIRHFPEGVRVALDLAVAGGTDPRVKVGLEVTGKGPSA